MRLSPNVDRSRACRNQVAITCQENFVFCEADFFPRTPQTLSLLSALRQEKDAEAGTPLAFPDSVYLPELQRLVVRKPKKV